MPLRIATSVFANPYHRARGTVLIKTLPKFKTLIMNGIGRHRAYGYGMVQLKQPHPPRVPRHLQDGHRAGVLEPQRF